jgi:hypothetical protein
MLLTREGRATDSCHSDDEDPCEGSVLQPELRPA